MTFEDILDFIDPNDEIWSSNVRTQISNQALSHLESYGLFVAMKKVSSVADQASYSITTVTDAEEESALG